MKSDIRKKLTRRYVPIIAVAPRKDIAILKDVGAPVLNDRGETIGFVSDYHLFGANRGKP